ncbi:MAG: hypothetical protein B7Z75_09570 [Acidocella sp. 20-57-95]|nr:MAG: hypothetical protein B7Z75_09570 [Acidocella sp. 20-57-95]OYV59528.1 MAG: hypothetical protein B7Z71_07905 [Acidocella sp. 21-58-7]HQT65162.1 diguanylate cyclase [Acidocella sp.]HQU04562.1 diguanylate cyclase [Acidocella sp.]
MISLTNIRFRSIVEAADDVIIVTTPELEPPGPVILYVNPAFTRLTGYSAAEVMGRSPRILQGPGTSRMTLQAIRNALAAGREAHEKILNFSKAGAPYWLDMRITPLHDDHGRLIAFVAIERDVTLDKRRLDEQEYTAERDTLTGLPNLRAFTRNLDAIVAAAYTRGVAAPCVAYIDIDKFRRVSETYGELASQAVIFALADLLTDNIRRVDSIGKLSHDRFGICMPSITLSDATTLCERLRTAIAATPFVTPAGPVRLSVSIGISMVDPDNYSANDVLLGARQAMRKAKDTGRNRVSVNQPTDWP